MQFTVSGTQRDSGERLSVTWSDGMLDSDEPGLVLLIIGRAATLEGKTVGPPEGPYTKERHLQNPLSALILMCEQFDTEDIRITGDMPRRPDIPDGAIG